MSNKSKLVADRDVEVVYVGDKRPKVDKTFGTRLRFMPGQAHFLRSSIADAMFEHPQVYAPPSSPEVAAFIKRNPLDAHQQGLCELSPEELIEVQSGGSGGPIDPSPASTLEDEDSDDGMVIDSSGQGEETDLLQQDQDALHAHFESVEQEVNAILTKALIQEWVAEQGLDVALTGTKADFVEQAIQAYRAAYPKGR